MNDKVKLVIKVVVLVFIVGILIVKFTWPSADGPASVPSDTVPGPVASSADASNLVCVPEANTTPQEKAQNAPQETSKNTLQGNNDSRQATNSGEKQDQPSTNATQKQPTWMLFRSTTCIPCVEMQKTFDLLKPEFKNKVQFIAIDVNDPANAEILKAFKNKIHSHHLPFR